MPPRTSKARRNKARRHANGTGDQPVAGPSRQRDQPSREAIGTYDVGKERAAFVSERLARRCATIEKKRGKGDALKDEGNALFRDGKYEESIKKYLAATAAYGPRAVYMNNLAAALLKLECWLQAEDAASQALYQNPKLLKARYRRGLARKEQGDYVIAIGDFEKVLELDSNCVEAKQELVITRDLLLASHKARKADRAHDDGFDEDEDSDVEDYDNDSKLEPWEVEMFALPALSDADMETPFESDTADFEHEGNDVPCRFYNHEGCNQGTECKYKHAPDDRSVRDHLGQNVCMYYLLGICKFGADRCYYAHDKAHLERGGWWNDRKKLAQNLEDVKLSGGDHDATVLDEWFGAIWNGSLRRGEYCLLDDVSKPDIITQEDVEAMEMLDNHQSMGSRAPLHLTRGGRGYKSGAHSGAKRKRRRFDFGEEDGRMENYGFTHDETMELLSQGVKPWDNDAWDVMHALGGDY